MAKLKRERERECVGKGLGERECVCSSAFIVPSSQSRDERGSKRTRSFPF